MASDPERTSRVRQALLRRDLDALVCALPAHVLMVTGYWPVIGSSVAVYVRDGRCVVLAPEDEEELAQRGWAEVRTFQPTSLDRLQSIGEAVSGSLRALLEDLELEYAAIGYERGPASEPASYSGMHLYGGSLCDLLRETARGHT